MTPEQLIFIHIPKTAGTTLRKVIENKYKKNKIISIYPDKRFININDFEKLNKIEKDFADIFIGHFSFGFHKKLTGNRKFKYATMLRNPVDRCLSLYNHLQNIQFAGRNLTFDEILQTKAGSQFRNIQSRYISGRGSNNLFETAIRNIDKYYIHIGLTEKFNESLLLASHELNWDLQPYKKLNITSSMWPTDFADELRNNKKSMEIIKKLNQDDLRLYYTVEDLIARKLDAMPSDELKKLEIFKL